MGVASDGRPAGLRRARSDPRLIPSYAYPCDGCGAWRTPGGYGECVSCGRQPMLDKMPTRTAYVPCRGCGRPSKHGRCHRCSQTDRQWWTRPRIIEAIQAWNVEHGRPPRAREWTTAGLNHPGNFQVRERFGSWNAGIAAAGFRPIPWRRTDSHYITDQREGPRSRTGAGQSTATTTDADKKPLQIAYSCPSGKPPGASEGDGTVAA